jgi:hypothetical protein
MIKLLRRLRLRILNSRLHEGMLAVRLDIARRENELAIALLERCL